MVTLYFVGPCFASIRLSAYPEVLGETVGFPLPGWRRVGPVRYHLTRLLGKVLYRYGTYRVRE